MFSRRNFLFGSVAVAGMSVSGCASFKKIDSVLVKDFELFKKGIESFTGNIVVRARAETKDFERLVMAKIAITLAENKIKKSSSGTRKIISDVLYYLEDAAIVASLILTYVPAPYPASLIATALKTLLPIIANVVSDGGKYKVVYTGMTPDQARAFLSSL